MSILIGITGKARAGKDTFSRSFTAEGFMPLAFADLVKQVTALLAQEPTAHFYQDQLKELHCDSLGMTRRAALQKVGGGMRDALGDQVWVNAVLSRWRNAGRPNAIVTDVRYDNEAAMVRNFGGFVVRVVRPDNVGLQGAEAAHASEAGVSDDLVDFTIPNSGSLEDLHRRALDLLAYVRGMKFDWAMER